VDNYDEYDRKSLVWKKRVWYVVLGSSYSRQYGDFFVGDENGKSIVCLDRDVPLASHGFGKIKDNLISYRKNCHELWQFFC
jgi:hypothetical protein